LSKYFILFFIFNDTENRLISISSFSSSSVVFVNFRLNLNYYFSFVSNSTDIELILFSILSSVYFRYYWILSSLYLLYCLILSLILSSLYLPYCLILSLILSSLYLSYCLIQLSIWYYFSAVLKFDDLH